MYRILTVVAIMCAFVVSSAAAQQFFRVSLENIDRYYAYWSAGVLENVTDQTHPAILPGDTAEVVLAVPPGGRLSFVTMFVESNDLFYAPDEKGIALRDENGRRISGDVTDQVYLWDAGTEENEEPGLGANQPLRQSAPNTGPADPDSTVRMVSDGYTYPDVGDVIRVTVTPIDTDSLQVTVRIENVSTSATLMLSDGTAKPVPLTYGPAVVYTVPAPFFTTGMPEPGQGLEALAEDGDALELATTVFTSTGLTMLFAPGVWATHAADSPLFTSGEPDRGMGLEALAEDGSPGQLAEALAREAETTGGAFLVPSGSPGPAPLLPGNAYEFTIAAKPGASLSLATMLVQTNDLFVAPDDGGIPLWVDGQPVAGDMTEHLRIWDAGTEINEPPGIGPYQAPRQMGPNMGMDEGGAVRLVDDGFLIPEAAANFIRLTIRPLLSQSFNLYIENVSNPAQPVILAPGVALVHAGANPVFTAGMMDRGYGLESLAEDGMPAALGAALGAKDGYVPMVFQSPVGVGAPGPLLPGLIYKSVVSGAAGSYLSFATMFVHSNDLFYAPDGMGIPLFDQDGNPVNGNVTDQVMLWDAGTEANEEPGAGPNQPPNQSGPNTGPADPDSTVRLVNDGFTYPDVATALKVIIEPNVTAIEAEEEVPSVIRLHQNFPNPFNPSTTIAFDLPEAAPAHLSVYNLLGQHIVDLASGRHSAGTHQVTWNGQNSAGQRVATGLYIYRLMAGDANTTVRTMLLLR